MVAFAYEYAVLGERLFREKNFSATFAEAIDRFWPGAAEAWSALEALNGLNDEPVLRSPSADTPLLRCANTTVQWPLRGPLRVMGASGGKVPDPKRTPSGSAERVPTLMPLRCDYVCGAQESGAYRSSCQWKDASTFCALTGAAQEPVAIATNPRGSSPIALARSQSPHSGREFAGWSVPPRMTGWMWSSCSGRRAAVRARWPMTYAARRAWRRRPRVRRGWQIGHHEPTRMSAPQPRQGLRANLYRLRASRVASPCAGRPSTRRTGSVGVPRDPPTTACGMLRVRSIRQLHGPGRVLEPVQRHQQRAGAVDLHRGFGRSMRHPRREGRSTVSHASRCTTRATATPA
jgi:hypothetical protein